VKKLGWKPDLIHCHGWFTAPMPLYIKKVYNKDPHFSDTKVVYSLYNDAFSSNWDSRYPEKLAFDGVEKEVADELWDTSHTNITRTAVKYADGVAVSSEHLSAELQSIFDEADCFKQQYVPEEQQAKCMSDFFNKVIEAPVLI
jgi:starch synthase